jgi:hypothetical protein
MAEEGGFFALELIPVWLAGPPTGDDPTDRLSGFSRRSGCVPAEPHPPPKQPKRLHLEYFLTMGPKHYSPFVRTYLSPFARTTTRLQMVVAALCERRFIINSAVTDRRYSAETGISSLKSSFFAWRKHGRGQNLKCGSSIPRFFPAKNQCNGSPWPEASGRFSVIRRQEIDQHGGHDGR